MPDAPPSAQQTNTSGMALPVGVASGTATKGHVPREATNARPSMDQVGGGAGK